MGSGNDQLIQRPWYQNLLSALGRIVWTRKRLEEVTRPLEEKITRLEEERHRLIGEKAAFLNYFCALVAAVAEAAGQMRTTRASDVSNARLAQWRSDLMFEAVAALLLMERVLTPQNQPAWFVELVQDVNASPAAPAAAARFMRTDPLDYHRHDLADDQAQRLVDLVCSRYDDGVSGSSDR